MANYVPFENLKVGETYYMYSTYWWETLGKATITELNPYTGTGHAKGDWGQNPGDPFMFGVDDGFHNDLFWDAEPTKEEVLNQKENGKKYLPPRRINGKDYTGGNVITGELCKALKDFIKKLNNTFETDNRFKQSKYDKSHYFMWESKLDYIHPSELLITARGECDWPVISYIERGADVNVHAGEKDSFGWLTGCIDKKMPDGTVRTICYG